MNTLSKRAIAMVCTVPLVLNGWSIYNGTHIPVHIHAEYHLCGSDDIFIAPQSTEEVRGASLCVLKSLTSTTPGILANRSPSGRKFKIVLSPSGGLIVPL